MRKLYTKAMLALAVPGLLAAVPAAAAPGDWSPNSSWSQSESWNHGNRDHQRGYNRGYDRRYDSRYSQRRSYDEPVYYNTRTWRGDDGRNYCRHSDGTTGLLVGGVAGALIGREVAGRRGDRTLGAILGAAGGALLGREVDRGGSRCR